MANNIDPNKAKKFSDAIEGKNDGPEKGFGDKLGDYFSSPKASPSPNPMDRRFDRKKAEEPD